MEKEIEDITDGIQRIKYENGERYTIKQLEQAKRQIQTKLDNLNKRDRKDDVVTFEELGVDKIFVDEAHNFKNRARRCYIR